MEDIGAVPDLSPSDSGTERTYKSMLNSKLPKKKFRSIKQLKEHAKLMRGMK